MKDILNDINAMVGVTGCFICNDDGEVTASALPNLFDENILSTVGRTMTQTMVGLATARRRKISDIDLVYSEGRLIAKNLGEGCLCILCVRDINVPLLNLTAKVAVKKLRAQLAEKKRVKSTEAAPGVLPETVQAVSDFIEHTEVAPGGPPETLRAMSDFIEQLMEELGDKESSRDGLLKRFMS